MSSVGYGSLAGAIEFGTFWLWGSVVVVEEGSKGWTGSGAGGTGLEGLGSVAGVVVEVGMATPGGGGCDEGPGAAPVDVGSFFWPGRMVPSRL